METITLTDQSLGATVERAAAALRTGGVILYPTDTLYGLGADAFSDKAVAKIYEIKKRDGGKPIHCVVSDIDMAAQYAEVDQRAMTLAQHFLPGPLTLILKKKSNIRSGIAATISTIGIRIPDHEFCLALARTFGKPYTTTSANVSTMPQARYVDDIILQLGKEVRLIDVVVHVPELPMRLPSTVVDLSGPELTVLREGGISVSKIEAVLRG